MRMHSQRLQNAYIKHLDAYTYTQKYIFFKTFVTPESPGTQNVQSYQ